MEEKVKLNQVEGKQEVFGIFDNSKQKFHPMFPKGFTTKHLFKGLFSVTLIFMALFVLNSCEELEEYEYNANGHYCVVLLDEKGAIANVGHIGLVLISPTEFAYCSSNDNDEIDYTAFTFSQSDYDFYVQQLKKYGTNKPGNDVADAEYEYWKIYNRMFGDIARYNRAFFIKLPDQNVYYEMLIKAKNESSIYDPLWDNCVHYVRRILSVPYPEVMNVSLTFKTPRQDYVKLRDAVNGTEISEFSDWIQSISKQLGIKKKKKWF